MSTESTETYNKVVEIVAATLTIDKNTLKPEATFESLGADSLDMLEVIMKLEEAFNIEIDDEKAAQITTIDEAVKNIEALKK